MKLLLILFNLSAALLVFPLMALTNQAQITSGISMYVEMDRAEIIDHARLKEVFPKEAGNHRYDIPKRFMTLRKHAWLLGYPCIVIFSLNALLVGIFWPPKMSGI
jgi:hypothetical protein